MGASKQPPSKPPTQPAKPPTQPARPPTQPAKKEEVVLDFNTVTPCFAWLCGYCAITVPTACHECQSGCCCCNNLCKLCAGGDEGFVVQESKLWCNCSNCACWECATTNCCCAAACAIPCAKHVPCQCTLFWCGCGEQGTGCCLKTNHERMLDGHGIAHKGAPPSFEMQR